MTAFAGFPLLAGGRLVGVMALFNRRPFCEVALQALDPAADNIAMGIQRREAEHAQLATEEEFRAARQFSRTCSRGSALPSPASTWAGASLPGRVHGGRLLRRFFPLRDGTLGVVIGDVSGHGMGPALLMASTRAYLHALALTQTDPSAILALVNQALVDDTEDQFITLLLGALDPEQRRIHLRQRGPHARLFAGPRRPHESPA